MSTTRKALTLINGITGAVLSTIAASAPEGWLLMNGDTMGSAASGATRASADYETLYKLLWDSMTNTQAPVSGGRGASAAADWAANKTITLPDLRGRAVIGTGTGSGLTARTHGAPVGNETHTLSVGEMPLHGHPFRTSSATAAATGGLLTGSTSPTDRAAFTGTLSNTAGEQIGGTGGGGAHANMQPSIALNYIIKT